MEVPHLRSAFCAALCQPRFSSKIEQTSSMSRGGALAQPAAIDSRHNDSARRERRMANAKESPNPSVVSATPPRPCPPPGLYRHYKGADYRVLGCVRHSESEEWLVLYRALYGERGLWVRPLAMFVDTVEVGGRPTARFARLDGEHEGASD